MMETMIRFLEKQLEMAKGYSEVSIRKSFYDQAFGGLSFAIVSCGNDWDEADKYVELWNNGWRQKFEEVVYGIL